MTEDPASGRWRVDRRIPAALIATILAQTGAAIWWAASTTAAMSAMAADQRRLELRQDGYESRRDDLSTRVIRIEEKLSGQAETLQRILRSVERDDWKEGR